MNVTCRTAPIEIGIPEKARSVVLHVNFNDMEPGIRKQDFAVLRCSIQGV